MKILMLNYEFPPIGGGAANANLYLLKQYAGKEDLQIDVLTSDQKPGFVKENFADNITIHKVGIHKKHLHFWRRTEVIEWLIKAGPVYKKLIKENDYELAHAFFGFPTGWLSYQNAKKLPYIISLRGSDVPGDNARLQLDYKILGPIFKAIWNKASGLVACSEGLKKRAMKFMPYMNIDVIPNGVELENYYPSNEIRETKDELRLITSGRLSATKRVDMLIEAVEILRKSGYKIHFTIAGDGSLGDSLKQLISQKKLDSCIEMSGRVEPANMPDLYRASDIYISATMQEGMSNSMLEALACGLPVVTTYCEGVEELITDTGIVTKHAHADLLADAIGTLADNRDMLQQMSIAARQRAEMFNWQSAAEKYINYYKSILVKNEES
ncbi:MAG: glycosyltransferase family 4 protein [Sedimentisphaerales bacterium]|nr:glycosyltransferase family 4 protein [Sedimentisphaerales bacterium]